MNTKKKVPIIRIKGFNDDWERRKLGELVEFSKGTGYSKGDLKEFGTPIILYGRLYTNYETVIKDVDTFVDAKNGSVYSCGGEVIIPASGETAEDISVASVVGKSGILLGGDLNIITPPSEIDSAFLALSISNGKPHNEMAKMAQGKSIVHLHNSDLEKIELAYPSYEEQVQISTYFGYLDHLITLHQREIDRIVCLRKAMVEKMFPQNGADVPAVRFSRYKEPWRLCQFSEIFTERHIIDTISDEYPQLAFTIEEGVIRPEDKKTNKRDFLIIDKATKKYLQTEYDDIIYNPANVIYGAIHRNALGKGCVSPIYKIFYTDQDSTFMECIVRHPNFIKEISRSMEGTVKKLRTLKPKAFLEMSAYIAPTIEEQRQIGEYFRQMDRLIEIEKEELEKIKHIKSACLEKMFV